MSAIEKVESPGQRMDYCIVGVEECIGTEWNGGSVSK